MALDHIVAAMVWKRSTPLKYGHVWVSRHLGLDLKPDEAPKR